MKFKHFYCISTMLRTCLSMVSVRQIAKQMEPLCIYSQKQLDHLSFSREHIVPVSKLKQALVEAKRDAFNLVPCHIGLNILKSNKVYGPGKMKFEPDFNKGMVARTCKYMSERYKFDISAVIDTETMTKWIQLPIEPYEIRHYTYVKHYQQESEFDYILIEQIHLSSANIYGNCVQ